MNLKLALEKVDTSANAKTMKDFGSGTRSSYRPMFQGISFNDGDEA